MPRRISRHLLASMVLVAAWALGAPDASAQLVGNPAGPRPGPVYELSLRSPSRAVIDRLTRLGFNIDHVTPQSAEIYATAGEYEYLVAQGYSVALVGTQPAPPAFPRATPRGLGVYHNYAGLTAELQNFASAYPTLTRLISIGQSVQGRELWALLITQNPLVRGHKPEFRYISTMHGDEPVGTEMCLYFIDHLLTNYGSDATITSLVNETAIWILPLMNPDGLELGTRYNANGFDLNRSFPDYPSDYTLNYWNGAPYVGLRQPEVADVMYWSLAHTFVLSANFHTGAVVASYPYDANPPLPTLVPAPTPDAALFLDLATAYASNNPPMFANNSPPFVNGTVNGNDWYIVQGGMQDWLYRYMGDDDVTIELASPKKPAESLLPTYWNNNRASMMAYLQWVHRGVRGTVTDLSTGDPVNAIVGVSGDSQPVFVDLSVGDYYRLLRPGTYTLNFEAVGYDPVTVTGVAVTAGAATSVDVQMVRATGLSSGGGVSLTILMGIVTFWGSRRARKSRT